MCGSAQRVADTHVNLIKCQSLREGNNMPPKPKSTQKTKKESDVTHVLLVEDSPGDVRLIREALCAANSSICLHVATDGAEAMAFLKREGDHAKAPLPKLILLDLNLPKLDGREILSYLKREDGLLAIPTVVISASEDEADIEKCYQFRANCYVQKPKHLDAFRSLVEDIHSFWLLNGSASPQTVSV